MLFQIANNFSKYFSEAIAQYVIGNLLRGGAVLKIDEL